MATNKTCIVCGGKYEYCTTCSKYDRYPTWMNQFDTENCKDLFMVATDYNAGELTLGEAKDRVKKLDISNIENYSAGVKNTIQEILTAKEDKVVKQQDKEKVEAPVVTEKKETTSNDMPIGLSSEDKEDYQNFMNVKRKKRNR